MEAEEIKLFEGFLLEFEKEKNSEGRYVNEHVRDLFLLFSSGFHHGRSKAFKESADNMSKFFTKNKN